MESVIRVKRRRKERSGGIVVDWRREDMA